MTERPRPWLLKHLGMLAPGTSPVLREDYARRAGIAAGYREAAGITDPGRAVPAQPHRANPELDAMRLATMKAVAIRENVYAAMTRGELEARILDGDRAQAAAPAEVSGQLRITAQAEADAWRQSADAAAARDQPAAVNAQALARQLAAEKTRLEAMNAIYEAWSSRTSTTREAAAQAKAELGRRGHARADSRSRRRWPDGGASPKPASTPWTAPSSASTRPPSPQPGPGHRSTLHRPEPRTLRQRRSSPG